MQRFGMVIGLRDESLDEYKALHAGSGVRDLLHQANIRNFNIFVHRLPDGKLYEFAYYEYVGTDYPADMAKLDNEPRNLAWLAKCNPMQTPLPGAVAWTLMEQVYLNE